LEIIMKPKKSIPVIAIICACVAASSANAATIPAGTTITVSTVSLITSQQAVGSTFEAKIAKGGGVLKAGTKAFGKVSSSRRNPRKSEPLSVELTSVEVNGRRVSVKTNAVEPHGPPQTARQAHYGHTAGTTVVNPKTTLQFQLLQPVTL
jgi:hypothetical protein